MNKSRDNIDEKVVKSFGEEWGHYKNHNPEDIGLKEIWDSYFDIFPFDKINKDSEGFDMGCGSGRWANFMAPYVAKLNCIDPSEEAINVAKNNLSNHNNCEFECAGVMDTKLSKNSQDFGYSLGVLHHIPDTLRGIQACASLLKPGAPFLLYLYYKFDDKPWWFKILWRLSELARFFISRMPFFIKRLLCIALAALVYFPFARTALLLEKLGINYQNIPLQAYRSKKFYIMLNDSLDRFGTRLERRFHKNEVESMMIHSGFTNISFAKPNPGWVCIGYYNP